MSTLAFYKPVEHLTSGILTSCEPSIPFMLVRPQAKRMAPCEVLKKHDRVAIVKFLGSVKEDVIALEDLEEAPDLKHN